MKMADVPVWPAAVVLSQLNIGSVVFDLIHPSGG